MKRTLLSLFVIALSIGLFAQNSETSLKEGKVVYEEYQKLELHIEGIPAEFLDKMPKERRSKKELIFTEDLSLYQNAEKDDNEEDIVMHGGGAMIQMKTSEPDNKLFYDANKSATIEQREFMTRVFLIEGEIKKGEWKMTGEQKTILDYECMQAVKENEEGEKTTAWYCPSIPVSSGPSSYLGLPGLVLQVDQKDGDHTLTAQSVEFSAVNKSLLKKPKKGKKVSREEFDTIVKEKMEEMGAEGGGSGGAVHMIKIGG